MDAGIPLDPRWDELANVLTHLLGFFAGIVGFTLFALKLRRRSRNLRLAAACLVFTVSLCTMYLGSATYHAAPPELKRTALVFDQVGIFMAIAGTAAAYGLLTKSGFLLQLLIWPAAGLAIVMQLKADGSGEYAALFAVALAGLCMMLLSFGPKPGFGWIIAGGLVYLFGIPFLAAQHTPFAHACWHLFVLLGSFCHYMALRAAAPRKKPRPEQMPLITALPGESKAAAL